MRRSTFRAPLFASRREPGLASTNAVAARSFARFFLGLVLAGLLALVGTVVPAPTASSSGLISQIGDDIDGEAAGDDSGYSVSMSSDGSRVAIGAIKNDGGGADAGQVRVYSWDGVTWSQLGSDIDGGAGGDQAGYSVSLSDDGSIVAVGSWLADSSKGEVRIFSWDGSSWVQLGADIVGEATRDYSGYSVSLSSDGSRVAIGAIGNSSNAGHVRVYDWDGSAWSQVGVDLDAEAAGDNFGQSVSLSSDGSRVAVGARYNDGAGSNAGHVQIYSWNGSSWAQLGADIDGEATGDGSGFSVALSSDGSRVAIGARDNDGNGSIAGHVRVYDWDGSAWSQLGSDLDGEAAGDQFGTSVSLSSDGSRLAIGAIKNDGGGADAGHARLFDWDGSSWVQLGADIDGEAAGDQSGFAVSLASNGSRLAIGAIKNDGVGDAAGHVRVYGLPALESDDDSNSSDDSESVKSSPGIYLALSGRAGKQVDGSVVRFGSYSIAPSSPCSLTVEGIDGTTFPRWVLARELANGSGHSEFEVSLSALPKGAYKIALVGYSRSGVPLTLTNHVIVDDSGQFKKVSPESVQPLLR